MNISITRVILLAVGVVLLIAGAKYGIDAIGARDWVEGIFALVGIAVGFALMVGRGITVSE